MHFRPKTLFTLMICFALTIFAWPAYSASKPIAPGDQEQINDLFKTLGIIKLAGIAPPIDIELEDLSGKMIRVSDFKGKIVFINFWATWCPDCRVEMPSMEKLFQRFKDRDFAMVAVDLRESPKKVKAFFKKYKLSFTALLDRKGRTAFPFGIRSIPTTFILNQKGGLIGKVLGPREWESEAATILFELLIKNKAAPAT
ncbi:MAG: TlpA disulfide reductase family protein [Desulfobacterales bacterium]